MKFVSKSSNLLVILTPSISAEPLSGRQATPGLSVRFEGGSLAVENVSICEKILAHPGLDRDFFLVKEEAPDPFKDNRKSIEPSHQITEMQFGQPTKSIGDKYVPQIPKELKEHMTKMINDGITEGMKKLVPALLETIKDAASKASQKKKGGRPPKKEVSKKYMEDETKEESAVEESAVDESLKEPSEPEVSGQEENSGTTIPKTEDAETAS